MPSASARTRPTSGARSAARADRRPGVLRRLAPVAFLLLAGCATGPPLHDTPDPDTACRALFARADAAVDTAGVHDAGGARIEGFPWLRVNRPLASFRDEVGTPQRFAAWVDRLAALDRTARHHELANLPASRRATLANDWHAEAARHGLPADLEAGLDACRGRLRADRLAQPAGRDRLRAAAVAPDEYVEWERVLGLYPIARRVARPRVAAFHRERNQAFGADALDRERVRRYAVPRKPDTDAARLARNMPRDALGIPEPDERTRVELLAAHAPVWAVETRTGDDRPGALVLGEHDRPIVDTDHPVEYRRLSWTRFHGRVLLQLNYAIWFPARPTDGWFDLYAGHLDGLVWRVTLGPDGAPLAYDSIHLCGCYYTLFPAAGWRVSEVPPDQEPIQSPGHAPAAGPDERLVVGLEARTHYLAELTTTAERAAATPLAPLPLGRLRSLPRAAGGSASAFAESGLIPSSARPERGFFWPLGVPSAGAMRQWGTHAIAFVGRRHFDDPYLLDGLLEREDD